MVGHRWLLALWPKYTWFSFCTKGAAVTEHGVNKSLMSEFNAIGSYA